MAELIGDLALVAVVKFLDCLAHGCVQHTALRRHQLLISDAAYPVVTEIDPLAFGGQDVASHQLLDSDRRVHLADLSGARQQREGEVPADCSGYRHQAFRQVGQAFQSRRHKIPYQARLALPYGRAVVLQRPHGLDNNERVTFARRPNIPGSVCGLRTSPARWQQRLDQCHGGRLRKRAQRDFVKLLVDPQFLERLRKHRCIHQLFGPHTPHDEDRQTMNSPAEEGEKARAQAVAPMQVLENEDGRLPRT